MKPILALLLMTVLALSPLAVGQNSKTAGKPHDQATDKVADPTAGGKSSPKVAKTYVMIFDCYCKEIETGKALSSSLRIRLGHKEEYEIIDHITTAEMTKPMPIETDPKEIIDIMTNKVGTTLGIYGTVERKGAGLSAELRCIDLASKDNPVKWTKTFADDTERAGPEIAMRVVEAITGAAEWKPPEVGDEKPPEKFGPPLNQNGDFEHGHVFWEAPDNCAVFLEKGPPSHGMILRIRTDLPNDPWLEYHRQLRLGLTTPDHPPHLKKDTGYGSVGGNEGVHYCSDYIPSTPGMRYWITADVKDPGGKIFIKGWYDATADADGLPEASMVERKITPQQFTAMPKDKQKQLVAEDAGKHPLRYLRECYRWFVNCGQKELVQSEDKDGWKHIAAPFPPRGGMADMIGPRKLKYLQIQIYPYWPAREYFYDNVWLYKDPRITAAVAEEAARTANFGKTSDVIEKATTRHANVTTAPR